MTSLALKYKQCWIKLEIKLRRSSLKPFHMSEHVFISAHESISTSSLVLCWQTFIGSIISCLDLIKRLLFYYCLFL